MAMARLWQALRAVPYGMQARVEARRSPPATRPGLRDLLARARRRSQPPRRAATPTREAEREAGALQFHTRLRVASMIAVLANVLLVLLEARYAPVDVIDFGRHQVGKLLFGHLRHLDSRNECLPILAFIAGLLNQFAENVE